MPLGQAINLIVKQKELHIQIPPNQMQKVIAAYGQRVAITGPNSDIKFRISNLDPCGDRRHASVNGMETIC